LNAVEAKIKAIQMNPSRDIQKLFDHFGGDAGDYQEIGRENEARNARTRWPLLATLDLSQPPIPGIAQKRDVLAPQTRSVTGGNANARTEAMTSAGGTIPTPITRGKPPLFARAHRKTIPPVSNVTLPAATLGGMRFSALAEAKPISTDTPELSLAVPESSALTSLSGSSQSMQAALALRRSPPAATPSLPRVAEATATPSPASASSILGRMFEARSTARQPEPAAASGSLQSMFQRLRAPDASPASDPEIPATPSWLSNRASRK
jgi:hypothetical protein